jgi:hypothetical protein
MEKSKKTFKDEIEKNKLTKGGNQTNVGALFKPKLIS